MFALLAALVFLLDLLGADFVDKMTVLGLFLLALHFVITVGIPWPNR